MTASITTNPIVPLPRDVDVNITITRPQTEIATDMSLLVFLTPNANNLPPNNGRFVIGSTANALLDALGWGPSDTGYWAVQAWAQQSPRPQRMAIGRVFTSAVPSQLMATEFSSFTALAAITDGSFIVTIYDANGVPAVVNVSDIDFTGVASVTGVATAIETAITAAGQENVLSAGVAYGGRLVLTARGTDVTISYGEAGIEGTDVATLLGITEAAGAQKWDGYTPSGLVDELRLVQTALSAAGSPAFVVTVDRQYRDTEEQKQLTDYIESNLFKMAGSFVTNLPTTYDSADTTNINKYTYNQQYRASSVVYSSYPQQYPDIAYPQSILATQYAGLNTTKTAKFKQGIGITPESITETQLQVLTRYNTNVYTRTGNTLEYFREGTQAEDTWWTDSYYGWSNLREELQVAVLNGLVRRPKTPLSRQGQLMVINDIGEVMQRYVNNGFLADRDEPDPELNVPYITQKAYSINPSPTYNSDRATRTLAPINIPAYEAGAIHKANINIDAVN